MQQWKRMSWIYFQWLGKINKIYNWGATEKSQNRVCKMTLWSHFMLKNKCIHKYIQLGMWSYLYRHYNMNQSINLYNYWYRNHFVGRDHLYWKRRPLYIKKVPEPQGQSSWGREERWGKIEAGDWVGSGPVQCGGRSKGRGPPIGGSDRRTFKDDLNGRGTHR